MFEGLSLGRWLNSAKSLPRFLKTPLMILSLSTLVACGKATERFRCAIAFSLPQKRKPIHAMIWQSACVRFRGIAPRDLIRKSTARYSILNRKFGLEPMAVLRIGQTPKLLLGLICESVENFSGQIWRTEVLEACFLSIFLDRVK